MYMVWSQNPHFSSNLKYFGFPPHSWACVWYTFRMTDSATTTPYIESSRAFLDKVMDTVTRKNADYCHDAAVDPLDNLRLSEKLNICSTETAIMSRMCDKIARARNLILSPDREAQVDESVLDTIEDIIGYALLLQYAVTEEK
jgi:hypothetical protein